MVQDERQDHAGHDAVEQAGAEGKHGVARAQGQGVVDHEAGVEDLAHDLDPQVLQGDGLGHRVGVEDGQQLRGKQLHEDDEHRRHREGNAHGDVDHPAGPVEFLCPQTLGDHGRGGGVEGQGAEQGHVLDLRADAAGGGGLDPVLVDEEGHGQPGKAHHGHLHRAGDAQLEHLPQLVPVHSQGLAGQTEEVLVLQNVGQADDEARQLRQHGRQGRAPHAPLEGAHEKAVQHDVAHGSDRHAVERLPGVAHRAQHGREGIVAKDRDDPQGADLEIGRRLVQRRGLQPHQDGAAQEINDPRHDEARQDRKAENGRVGLEAVLPVFRPEILAHEDVAAGGDAQDDLGEDLHDLAGVVDGGDAVLPDEPPGHDQVRDGIGRLEQRGEHHRPGIDE